MTIMIPRQRDDEPTGTIQHHCRVTCWGHPPFSAVCWRIRCSICMGCWHEPDGSHKSWEDAVKVANDHVSSGCWPVRGREVA